MNEWRRLIREIVADGIEQGLFRSTIDGDAVATIIISTIEGALMMSQLYGEPAHMDCAIKHLTNYVRRDVVAS